MNNYAYITLLSSLDYIPAALILNQSLRNVNSTYPLIILVTEDIVNEAKYYLEAEQIQYKIIPIIQYHKKIQMKYENKEVLNTASKLSILTLYEYDKIIYLDTDAVVYKNIDILFKYPDGSILREANINMSSLMVLSPKNHEFRYYYTLLQYFPELDGNLFEGMLFPAKSNIDYQIPANYFLNIMVETLSNYSLQDIYAVHFCFNYKPWKYISLEQYIVDFCKVFPNLNNNIRITIIKKYMEEYLYPLWEKYPELTIFCKNI